MQEDGQRGENVRAIAPVGSDTHQLSLPPQDSVGQRAGGWTRWKGPERVPVQPVPIQAQPRAPAQREVGLWEVRRRKMGARESPQRGRGMLGGRAVWGPRRRPPDSSGIDGEQLDSLSLANLISQRLHVDQGVGLVTRGKSPGPWETAAHGALISMPLRAGKPHTSRMACVPRWCRLS